MTTKKGLTVLLSQAFLSFLFLMGTPFSLHAQDSTWVLGLDEYLGWVGANHPVARQADLIPEQAQAELLRARGSFDPKLEAGFDQKYFDKKNYWRILGAGVKVPTWFGVELKGVYESANGQFLNSERTLPDQGLLAAGVSVPIGQDLLIDDRRATLQQAKIFREGSTVERIVMLNDLYYEAASRYWEWSIAFEQQEVFRQAREVAEQRLELVRSAFSLGDKPAVDTLEALIQLQTRQISLQQAQLAFRNTSLTLSNFLWDDAGTPLELDEGLMPRAFRERLLPDPISLDSAEQLIARLDAFHPEVLAYRYKLASLDVERRLKANRYLPALRFNYNVLNATLLDPGSETDFNGAFFTENYKWGVEFSFPLFLRKERGSMELTRIKIEQTGLNRDLKRLELANKVQAYHNELLTLQNQISLYEATVSNYRQLLAAEGLKFRTGESSLFLINSREVKLIDAELKFIELQGKYYKAIAGLAWVSGLLYGGE